jgi:hypothetical protein
MDVATSGEGFEGPHAFQQSVDLVAKSYGATETLSECGFWTSLGCNPDSV